MATFLTRDTIKESLSLIFTTAENEVIIIVPFIKLSEDSFKLLKEADAKGIELTIVYKEDKMLKAEKEKLYGLKNLNLLAHPDIHAKCYCNETKMIITSMNLYDYSEKYNREMGILLDLDNDFLSDEEFDDGIDEIRDIISSAKLEKKSLNASQNGFSLKILRPVSEYLRLSCKIVNKFFDNKKFDLTEDDDICCKNYFDNIDVLIEPDFSEEIDDKTGDFKVHRASLKLKWKEELVKKIHQEFSQSDAYSSFVHFKIYWNTPHNMLTIYRDWKKQPKWSELNNDQTLRKYKQGIDQVIDYLKKVERKFR